ncbi:UNVERIFIED_CONTAM: hypothetical protein Sradi_3095000 [Sesamum radiatum]|uniref:Transposase MuDR plant domain-containing protein n=1 Tax=Sesamum radiatum TaxID=300843 RepID=A0AAW2RC91_SESRA
MPPPAYHPESQTITVAFFYGGELKNLPVATCIGGKVKKFDYVNATHMNKSNLGLFAEKCGFTDVEGIRYYIMKNYGFKILLSDTEILESALEQLGKYREWCVYIEYNPPLPEEVAVNTGEEERIVHNTENRKGKGKIDGKGKGKAKKKLNFAEDIEYLGTDMEFLGETINVNENVDMVGLSRDNQGVDEPSRRGDVGVDDPDIEEDESDSDFLENDYDMNNDNSEDDDELFKEYVNETEDEHGTGLETSSESNSDDVVVSEADMDEHRVSDDDDKGSEHAVFNPAQIYDPSLELGMIFSSKAEFKKAVQSHGIRHKRSLKFTKNDSFRVYCVCTGEGCEWKIHATKIKNEKTFQINFYNSEHSCPQVFNVRNVKTSWLSERFLQDFKTDPKRNVKGWRVDIMNKLRCHVSRDQAYRAKRQALKKLEGSPEH